MVQFGNFMGTLLLQDFFVGIPILDLITSPMTLMFLQFSLKQYVVILLVPMTTFLAIVCIEASRIGTKPTTEYEAANAVAIFQLIGYALVGVLVYISCVLSVRSDNRLQKAQFSLYRTLKSQSIEFSDDAAFRGYRVALEKNRATLRQTTNKATDSTKTTTTYGHIVAESESGNAD